jgi:TatD DNase family protein
LPLSPTPSHLTPHSCLFDTHAHLTDQAFDRDRDSVIERALSQGVAYILCVGYDLESSRRSVELAASFAGNIYAAVGIHPHDADSFTDGAIEELKELSRHPKVKAIGETGLDFYRNYAKPENQSRAFESQIRLARELCLPLVIHIRDAHREAMNLLQREGYYAGVMHCFSGDQEFARTAVDLGFFLSFSGSITFNGKKLKSIIESAPRDRLLVETDCPFLTPKPERGKRNEPLFVGHVLNEMAAACRVESAELARLTTDNGKRCFGIS